MVWRWWWW